MSVVHALSHEALVLACPFCGFDNIDSALFCGRCRADVAGVFREGDQPGADFDPEPLFVPTALPQEDCAVVDLGEIVRSPAQFHAKRVRVVGFLHLEFEGNGLYVHQADFEPRRVYERALWVNVYKSVFRGPRHLGLIWEAMQNADLLNDHYVVMEGRISASQTGHFGLFPATIEEITRCDLF